MRTSPGDYFTAAAKGGKGGGKMRDTSAVCDCCGKREMAGQCVKGSPMCPCERDKDWLSFQALDCPKCEKCPVHCRCFDKECNCDPNLCGEFYGHEGDCAARLKSRYQERRKVFSL